MADYYSSLAAEIESDIESQVSDVDPAQVAKSVQDMDDLDADLFTSSRKTTTVVAATSSPKKSAFKALGDGSEKRVKARVSFDSPNKVAPVRMISKGFDEADPLADLLSDEDSLGWKKEKHKTGVAPPDEPVSLGTSQSSVGGGKRDKSKVISDLFGLGSDDAESKPRGQIFPSHGDESVDSQPSRPHSADWLGITTAQSANAAPAGIPHSRAKLPVSQKTGGQTANTEEDDDSMFKGMGLSEKKPLKGLDSSAGKVLTGTSKPSSLMDDLFGGSTMSVSSKGEAVGVLNPSDRQMGTKDVAQVGSVVSFGSYKPSVSTAREPRRSSRHTPGVADPLGIFSSSSQAMAQENTTEDRVTATTSSSGLDILSVKSRDQLGAGSEIVHPKPHVTARNTSTSVVSAVVGGLVSAAHQVGNTASLPEWLGGGAPATKEESAVHEHGTAACAAAERTATSLQPELHEGGVLAAAARLDQDVLAALQRQEAQLAAALEARQQQERLADVHRHQQEVLLRQEAVLRGLVDRQVERQLLVEAQLARQQERIAAYIQALLSQPVVPPVPVPTPQAVDVAVQGAVQSSTLGNTGVDRNQAQTPGATGLEAETRHREELERLEAFYKHHITLLESSADRLEARLRGENVRLEEEYQARITKLQEEQRQLEDGHKQKVAALQQERLADLQHLKQLYQREVDDLRDHYTRVATVEQDNSLQARSLQLLADQLGQSSSQLAALEGRADGRQRSELDVRDAALRAKEAELKATRQVLERQQIAAEQERERLVGLLADLELRAAERRAEVDGRAWELRQEAAKLDARARALEGERQRTLVQLEHDRRQLQELRRTVLEEQKQASQRLQEEQLQLGAEKARLEAVAHLQGPPTPHPSVDVQQVRLEAEAAMQVALDAARQADAERDKLLEQKRALTTEQCGLRERERELTVRAQELDVLAQVAEATKKEGLHVLRECRDLQQQHAARVAEHQRQASLLKERERRLAEEKAALSEERRALHKSREQDRFCSFCRTLLEHSGSRATDLKPPHKQFIDPEQVILRLSGERDHDDNSHSNFVSSLISK